jgi:hypothetical protein
MMFHKEHLTTPLPKILHTPIPFVSMGGEGTPYTNPQGKEHSGGNPLGKMDDRHN